MKYSYIKPRHKTPITAEAKLILTFFGITLFMLFMTYTFLLYKEYSFVKDLDDSKQKQKSLNSKLMEMKSQIRFIEKENILAEKIQTKNAVLKDSITNLFDLVPESITLSKAELKENALILYGITPNKDVYNFMLQAPLRSIFHKTYSSFYPIENGWLRFVSTNYTNEESELDDNGDLKSEN